MGTYLRCEANDNRAIPVINKIWNFDNPGYEDTFHLMTEEDMDRWFKEIHTNPELEHLRHIKNIKQLNEVFPAWGLGTFEVKITLGDYLCSEMARRYIKFFKTYGCLFFKENPVDDPYILELLEEAAKENHKAKNCAVNCPYCSDTK